MTAAAIAFACRVALIGVCVWAASGKLADVPQFERGLRASRLVPARLARLSAYGVVALELAAAVALVPGLAPTLWGPVLAVVLFGLLSAVVLAGLLRRRRTPCHCFGAFDTEQLSAVTALRALALLGVAVVALAAGDPGGLALGDLLAAGTAAVGLVLLARLAGSIPEAWGYLSATAPAGPHPTRRMSYRAQPVTLDGSAPGATVEGPPRP